MKLTKEEFVSYINVLKDHYDKQNKFTNAISIAFDGHFVYEMDASLTSTIIKLLSTVMNDTDEWIDYFIYELDYGEKYHDGCVTDKDKQIIDLSTPENLYKFLSN